MTILFPSSVSSLCCRPLEFLICDDPLDLEKNVSQFKETGYGCIKVFVYLYISFFYTSNANCI